MTATVSSPESSTVGEQPCESPRRYADVVEELFGEYGAALPLNLIAEVAHQCAMDLSCSPPAALPELLPRLARVRLDTIAASARPRRERK